MAESVEKAFNEGTKTVLSLKSDQWGIFGPTFKIKIPVTDLGDGMYKIAKDDWDATIGPIFDRMRDNILEKSKLDADKYRAISNGYLAMTSEQTQEFHLLMPAFSAAENPDRLNNYPGTVETNKYLALFTNFVEAFNGPEQSVLVSRTQLQGLANAARGAMEYAEEGANVADSAKEFYDDYEDKAKAHYSGGLINALT